MEITDIKCYVLEHIAQKQIESLEDSGPLSIVNGYITPPPEEPGLQPHPDWDEIEKRAVLTGLTVPHPL